MYECAYQPDTHEFLPDTEKKMPITFSNPDTHNIIIVHTAYSNLICKILMKKLHVMAYAHVPSAFLGLHL